MGLGSEYLVAAASLANGRVHRPVAGIDCHVIGQGEQLAADAVKDLLQQFRAAGLAGPPGNSVSPEKRCLPTRKQVAPSVCPGV